MRASLALCCLLTSQLSAQTRLFTHEDLAARAQVAAELDQLLQLRSELPVTIALAARAGIALPARSAARQQLDEALQRANASDKPPASIDRSLRLALGELVDVLTFEPRKQAELPAGFPGFQSVGEIELRNYPAYRMVRTNMRGGSMGAFWPLFRHIESNGIAMTTPVQMDWAASEGSPNRPAQMAFLYGDPSISPGQTADGVEVVAVEPQTVLSIGAIGDDRRDRIEAMQDRILTYLAEHGDSWELAGPWRTMGYNSPMVPRDRRYFELQVPVRRRQP